MENKNYYPLKVDTRHGSAIVSDTNPERDTYKPKDSQYEIDRYGGHIIAESLPSRELGQQLVEAYNEKYGPEKERTAYSVTVLRKNTRLKVFCEKMEEVSRFIINTGLDAPNNTPILVEKWGDKVKYDFAITIQSASLENSAHSFSEGSGVDPKEFNESLNAWQQKFIDQKFGLSINDQIKFLDDFLSLVKLSPMSDEIKYLDHIKENLIAIKRWNESPVYHGKIDVEKVIEDLLKDLDQSIALCGENPKQVASYQNAEAALGMLQAFKKERDRPKTYKEIPSDDPNYRKFETGGHDYGSEKKVITSLGDDPMTLKEKIINDLRDAIPVSHTISTGSSYDTSRLQFAIAIVQTIDEMINLRKP